MAAMRDYLPFVRRRNRAAAKVLSHRTRSGLVASAASLNLGDRTEARRVRVLRQGWQDDAWAYQESLGEIAFATRYMANSARRMRLYPAVYATGTYDDDPVPLADLPGLPPMVVAAADDALTALGSGRLAISQVMHDLSTQLQVAGEGYIHGHTDPEDGTDTWRIRSISEITVRNDEYVLREVPLDAQGVYGWEPLDPDYDFVARLWTPNQKFRMLATSPLKSILDSCEELMILSRAIRATGRSRLAGAGFLKVPNGLSIVSSNEDNDDPQSDDFLGPLTDAMLTPIGDEGVASAVVPLVIRGDAASLAEFQHMVIERPIDPVMAAQREELIGRIATGIDLPAEVLKGIVDLNHWSAWQVSDDTFRHHIEPHVQECVDALTIGYFRACLEADPRMQGPNVEWIGRLCLWYDPTDLVQHPDRSADALIAHERLAISDQAFREALGFSEKDAPTPIEIELRMVRNTRAFPPNVLEALFHVLDPSLVIPPMSTGSIPGMGPKGATEVPQPPPEGTAAPVPGTPALPGPPPLPTGAPGAPAIGASGARRPPDLEFSRALVNIDRELRMRLQVAASHAVNAVLNRAGARLRTRVQKDETMRTAIAHTANHAVAATLGRPVVAALNVPGLVDTEWLDVKATYDEWVAAAQSAALRRAAAFLGLPTNDPKVIAVAASQDAQRTATWQQFAQALTKLANDKLYDPDPSSDVAAGLDATNPDTVVPTGLIRQVMNSIGGGTDTTFDPADTAATFTGADAPLGQVATGDDIGNLLADNGADGAGYQWVHGFAINPFEPHADLDGVQFTSFTDPVLANSSDFPSNDYYLPGDHTGCTCDFMPLWVPGVDDDEVTQAGPDGTVPGGDDPEE